eukprot:scaffold13771_cov105-Isochrysis_galbana.AAC.6
MTERRFGSEYERLVLTKEHPAKATFSDVKPPEYIAQSRLGPFLATRWEELSTVGLLGIVAAYCAGVYLLVFFGFLSPVYTVLCYSWDVAAVSVPVIAMLGGKMKATARKLAFAIAVVLAVARWQYPELYPGWYPFQPAALQR